MSSAEASEDERESDYEEKRAARVTLCNALPKDVLDRVVDVEG